MDGNINHKNNDNNIIVLFKETPTVHTQLSYSCMLGTTKV